MLMMSEKDWGKVKHFGINEWVKDPCRASQKLVFIMDAMRGLADFPIHLHVCWDDEGHSTGSRHRHPLSDAVDFHFGKLKDGTRLTVMEQFTILSAFPFGAIGYYPFWHNPGWHVDLRDRPPRLYWVRDKAGCYLYGWKALALFLQVGF